MHSGTPSQKFCGQSDGDQGVEGGGGGGEGAQSLVKNFMPGRLISQY
jgi:hypothetical protein